MDDDPGELWRDGYKIIGCVPVEPLQYVPLRGSLPCGQATRQARDEKPDPDDDICPHTA